MKYLILAVVLVGCSMSNEEIVKQNKICKDGGMDVNVRENEFGVMRVDCVPFKVPANDSI